VCSLTWSTNWFAGFKALGLQLSNVGSRSFEREIGDPAHVVGKPESMSTQLGLLMHPAPQSFGRIADDS
jgi:hypothetical protein